MRPNLQEDPPPLLANVDSGAASSSPVVRTARNGADLDHSGANTPERVAEAPFDPLGLTISESALAKLADPTTFAQISHLLSFLV